MREIGHLLCFPIILSSTQCTTPLHPTSSFQKAEAKVCLRASALRELYHSHSNDFICNIALLHWLSVPLPSISFPYPNQIFEGNSNYDTPELRTMEPLLTRFIRVYPERATPAGMGLRLELLGCEIEGNQLPQFKTIVCI